MSDERRRLARIKIASDLREKARIWSEEPRSPVGDEWASEYIRAARLVEAEDGPVKSADDIAEVETGAGSSFIPRPRAEQKIRERENARAIVYVADVCARCFRTRDAHS